jgi:hypothetical protein
MFVALHIEIAGLGHQLVASDTFFLKTRDFEKAMV